MRAYSNDLREKIITTVEVGELGAHVARRFDVAKNFVYKIYKRYKEEDLQEKYRRQQMTV